HPDLGKVLRGHDFVDNDRHPSDPNGHGTFTAGIIGARRGNHRGIAGASRATILPVRVLNARGFGRDSDIAHGIRWAVNHHADVINLSLGGVRYSRITRDAARYAERHGVVVVASSGNSGGTRKSYPAAYPTVVAVGATDDNDQLTWFSQRGEWVDVVAPGWEIASTIPGNRYGLGSGTSFSAPLVSGAVALLVDAHPHWRPAKIRATLLRSTADAGAVGPDLFTGFGVIDVDGALGGRISTWAAAALGGKAETPTTARPLDRRVEGSLDPEGASPWFVYQSNATKKVSIEARFSKSRQGVLRGDLAFDVYDADMHLIRRVDRWKGSGTERTTFKTGASFYVRLRNTEQTRAPGHFVLITSSGQQRNSATVGGGPRPVLVDANPAPNATGVPRSGDLVLTLGRAILPTSISARTVRLIDGNTGESVARGVDYDPVTGTLTIDPVDRLAGKRDYALVLKQLRMPNGSHLTETWLGFRTG
ncbi:MAG: S8 family serine peptidase, partial [Candidatus Nanopelagicales bacterium]